MIITGHLPGVGGVQSVSVSHRSGAVGLDSVGGGVGGSHVGRVGGGHNSGGVSPHALDHGGGVSGIGNRGSSVGLGQHGGSNGLGDHWGMGSIADGGGSVTDGRGSVGDGSLVGDMLLGSDGLDDGGLLVGLQDGLSLNDVLLDSVSEDGGDDLLAVDNMAALVGDSGGHVVHRLSDLGDVGLLNHGDLGVHLCVSASGDDVLLHVGHGVASVASGNHGGLVVAGQKSSVSTGQNGGNNNLRRIIEEVIYCCTNPVAGMRWAVGQDTHQAEHFWRGDDLNFKSTA